MTVPSRSYVARPFRSNLLSYISVLRFQWIWGLVVIVVAGYIPIRLAIAAHQSPTPEAILTLGGRPAREAFTAELAAHHPNLDVWLSSGMQPDQARSVFRDAGVSETRVHLDYCAVDTVTNFTTMVGALEKRHIHHIYLITSDYHMPRATAIARFVLGSRGITFTPISVPSGKAPESKLRVARDVVRSLVWIVFGKTGASLNPKLR